MITDHNGMLRLKERRMENVMTLPLKTPGSNEE
jgi:hypothetical protein